MPLALIMFKIDNGIIDFHRVTHKFVVPYHNLKDHFISYKI